MSQPALQVGRVPAGHQARPLQGQQLGRGLRAGRHHRVEVKPQGGRVSVRPLVLPGEGGADQRLAARAPGRLCRGKFDSPLAPRLLRILLLLTPGHAPGATPPSVWAPCPRLGLLPAGGTRRPPAPRGGPASHLVPGVRPVRGVDEDGDDLGFGDQGGSALGGVLRVEVAGALLKQEVGGGVGRRWEEAHVPAGGGGG